MTKSRSVPVMESDLVEFVNQESDFAFEMRVLHGLRSLGLECMHAGTYRDPVTDKARQYDIRAVANYGQTTLRLAVECKNYRPHCPILLSTAPRTAAEAFHDLIVCEPGRPLRPLEIKRIAGHKSAYRPNEPVAKKTDQVRRDGSGKLISSDETAFEKLNQAVNSCRDLILQPPLPTAIPFQRMVVPLLVVPQGILWQVDYTPEGEVKTPPRQITHGTFFMDHAWTVKTGSGDELSYHLSHLELVTLDALPDLLDIYVGRYGFFQ